MKEFHLPHLRQDIDGKAGPAAAWRLFSLCFQHAGGSTKPIAEFLVSLYNADYARPDMAQVTRRIGDKDFDDVLVVMRWYRDVRSSMEIHNIFASDGSKVMSDLMKRFTLGPG